MIPILTGFPLVKGVLLLNQSGVDTSDYTKGWIEVIGINEVALNLSPNRTPQCSDLDTSDYTIAQPLQEAIRVWAQKRENDPRNNTEHHYTQCDFVRFRGIGLNAFGRVGLAGSLRGCLFEK